jgi:ATP-dependent helicase/nuclease subunit A
MTTGQQSMFRFEPLAREVRPPVRRNLVIEAGAGTGKTTAIVGEVLKLMLENEDLNPERIVLVTFTEKAAGEIADRIHDALADLSSRFDDADRSPGDEAIAWPAGSPRPLLEVPPGRREAFRRACVKQLARIDSLRSQTIHSFCQSLLRMYPIEAGLDPQFKIIEGFERSLLYGQLYDAWLDEETRTNPNLDALNEWEILLNHSGYLFLVREMIVKTIERRDLILAEGYDLGGIADVEDRLIAALDDVASFDEGRLCRYVKSTPRPSRGSSIDAWLEYLAPIVGEIRTLNLPKKKNLAPLAEAIKELRAGDKGDSIHDRLASHRAAMALQALSRRFIDFLDREKRKLGVVDFDDLLLRTSALLDDEAVLERVRGQFDYLFVDEFQDTDRTQARIIDRLARDRSGNYVPGKTIVVGDPKQSIYGFRRADPETYYRLTKNLIDAGAEKRYIEDQYRSDAPLVDAVNAIFGCLFPELPHDPNVFRPAYHRLRAARPDLHRDLDARITLLGVDQDEQSDRWVNEAEAVGRWILAKRDGSEFDLKRFAILFRRLTKIEDYLDTFDRLGIEYVLPPMRLFLDRRAPVDLLAVLRAVAHPFDRGAEISAARTPYFALTDPEIVDRGEPYERFLAALGRYRDAATHLGVAELMTAVVAESAIERVYDAAGDGERSRRYLDHLRDIAFEYDQKIGGSLRQFVDEITRRRNEPDEMEPSLIDESLNAVRILSVHAAKGLEFESVILPDLGFRVNPAELFAVEEPPRLIFRDGIDTLAGRYQFADERPLRDIGTEREDAEMRRLFYVGVTRAKVEVVFVCDTAKPRNEGFVKCLNDVFGERAWNAEGRELREVTVGGASIPVAFEKLASADDAEARARRRLRDAALEAELRDGALVPSDIQLPAIDLPLLDDPLKARIRGSHRAAGILLHRVLERWDGTSPVEPLLRALASEAAADDETVSKVRQRLHVVARSPAFARIAAAETIAREMPVHIAAEDGTAVTARIDRLIREGGRELVIDYKSGAPDPKRLDSDRAQVARYCLAISRITGRECGGMLWYVDVDQDEVVEV